MPLISVGEVGGLAVEGTVSRNFALDVVGVESYDVGDILRGIRLLTTPSCSCTW